MHAFAGRGSLPPRRSSPAGTTPPAASITLSARPGAGAVVKLRASPPGGPAAECGRGLLRRSAGGERDLSGRPPPTRPCAGIWCCISWRRCPCCGCGTTSSRHRVPARHRQRLDPGRARRPRGVLARSRWQDPVQGAAGLPPRRTPLARRPARPAAAAADADARAPPARRRARRTPRPGRGPGLDWRPLLRYTAGNPLTITVLVGQALRDGLTSTAQIQAFVDRLRAGEAELEQEEEAALGRPGRWPPPCLTGSPTLSPTLSAASSRCCTCSATPSTPKPSALMATPAPPTVDAVPQLAGLTRDAASRCWTAPPPSACCLPWAAATMRSTPPCPGTSPPCSPISYARPLSPPAQPVRPRLHPCPRLARRLLPRPGRRRR